MQRTRLALARAAAAHGRRFVGFVSHLPGEHANRRGSSSRRGHRSLAVGAATALLTIGLGAVPSNAVVPGANGRLVFVRVSCQHSCGYSVISANPDDTDEVVLAGPYTRDAFDDHFIVNWSPDGSSVVFMANQAIWQVGAEGTRLHRIFQASGSVFLDDGPAFTPDGKRIVFPRCCLAGQGQGLWSIRPDGTGLKQLTMEPATDGDGPADAAPQVAPDGRHIVFARCFPDRPCVVATVAANGSGLRELTASSAFGSGLPNWSPDSSRIVFTQHTSGGNANVASISPDGSDLRFLTDDTGPTGLSSDASYAPDGSRIVFAHALSTGGVDLFTMRPDGSDPIQLTRTSPAEMQPQWAAR